MTAKKTDSLEKAGVEAGRGHHPIQVVARRTGLSAEVIRVWERRYSAVVPDRTPTGRRMYSDDDVERLKLLRKATLAGRRISEIAGLSVPDLRSMVLEDVATAASVPIPPSLQGDVETESFIQQCLASIRDLDSDKFQSQIMMALTSLSGEAFVENLIAPLFRRIGEEWEAGRIESFHEHMASSVVRSVLLNVLSAQQRGNHTIVLATPSGQHHEIGITLASIVAATSGWRVVYLGTDLPAADIAKAAEQTRARVVALSLLFPTKGLKQELRELGRLLPPGTSLLVGGQGIEDLEEVLSQISAVTLSNYAELREALTRMT